MQKKKPQDSPDVVETIKNPQQLSVMNL